MSTSTLPLTQSRSAPLTRLADYAMFAKPRLTSLVLITVVTGAILASWTLPDVWLLLNTVIGTSLIATSSSVFNQLIECRRDAVMPRTSNRPLPSGRVSTQEAVLLGIVALLAGTLWLSWLVNATACVLALATWVIYVGLYTPLKARTTFNTVVGAVAGGMPAMIGWAAVGGTWNVAAATLFLIIYLWQFPHFMAIAWLYRDQYSRAGMKMLASADSNGRRAGRQALAAALALVCVSLVPVVTQSAGIVYFGSVLMVGGWYAVAAGWFWLRLDEPSARRLLRVSLVYLPLQLGFLLAVPLI
jgi:protoheme IX farnesyltransferase